ncbi:MAG TPA: S1 family peptidase, partial [Kineosporiaceae bacterium]|nr:S1 family peptidase [Kineosporiaceae bacterium]
MHPARLFTGVAAAAMLVTTFGGGSPAGALTVAPVVEDGDLPFVAKVDFGEQNRGCTGALVATRWVVTAKSCFADGTGEVVAGVPSRPVNVVLGRTDLTTTTGHRRAVISLIPHPERNLVLAELSAPVNNIAPLGLDGGAPQEGESLRIAGYGRTGTEWVPDRLHAGTFTVGAVAAAGFAVTGSDGATICKGDAGGPAFREAPAGPQLIGINDTSWQKGCFGESETQIQDGATEARTDDLAGWIRSSTAVAPDALRQPVTGEFNRDGIQDLIAADAAGKLWLYPGTTSGTRWGTRTQIGTGWSGYREFVIGKINRDAYDDLVTVNTASGDLWMYPGTAAGIRFGARVQIGNGWSSDFRDLAIGKVNRDAYDDLVAVKSSSQELLLYKGNATGPTFDSSVVI